MSEIIRRKIEQKEEPHEHLIVEVGSGILEESDEPAYWNKVSPEYWEWFENTTNARFVGIDIREENLARAKAETPQHNRISFLRARAEALPLEDGSVQEMILKNVLGDPDIAVETKHAALIEAARVVKKGGTLRVVETFTPVMVHEDNLYAYIDDMDGAPFTRFNDEEDRTVSLHEKSADAQLMRDEAAADTMKLGQSFVIRYRRT